MTTTTFPPPPPPVLQPIVTEVPAAEAGTVNIVVNGLVVTVDRVKSLSGWTATVDRSGDSVVVTFRKNGKELRFLADLENGELATRIQHHGTPVSSTRTWAAPAARARSLA